MDVSNTKQVKKLPKSLGNSILLQKSLIEDINNDQITFSEEETLMNAFEFFDSNKKGYISCREYFSILLGTQEFKEDEIQKILDASNLNINGVVDYRKFYSFWKNK